MFEVSPHASGPGSAPRELNTDFPLFGALDSLLTQSSPQPGSERDHEWAAQWPLG